MPVAALLPFLPAIIGAGASVAGSVLGNKKKEQTSTSTSTPTLSPQMQQMMDKLLGHQQGIMDNPMQGLAPIKTNQMEQVNRNYAGSQDRISTALAKRGYSGSGKAPGAFVGLERGRLGELSNIDSTYAQIGSDRQMQGANSIQQILSSMKGSTTNSTGTMPGNGLGAGLSGAGAELGNLSLLTTLSKMLKGGGSTTPMPG